MKYYKEVITINNKTTENITGQRIKQLLKQKNLKQKDLAEALETTVQTVSKWVNGHMVPDKYFLMKLSDYLDVSERYLIGRSDDDTSLKALKERNKRWTEEYKHVFIAFNKMQLIDKYVQYLGLDTSPLLEDEEKCTRFYNSIDDYIRFLSKDLPEYIPKEKGPRKKRPKKEQ